MTEKTMKDPFPAASRLWTHEVETTAQRIQICGEGVRETPYGCQARRVLDSTQKNFAYTKFSVPILGSRSTA